MPTTASLSSEFCIYILLDGEGKHTIENPGRPLRVIGVKVYNEEGTPEVGVENSDGDDIVEPVKTVDGGWKDMPISSEGAEVSAVQNLVVVSESESITQIVISCLASGGGKSLTVL